MPIQIMVMPMPIVPISMPIRIINPSRFNNPNDMINIPQPGGKFVNGKGKEIDSAKTNEKNPMMRSQVWAAI